MGRSRISVVESGLAFFGPRLFDRVPSSVAGVAAPFNSKRPVDSS